MISRRCYAAAAASGGRQPRQPRFGAQVAPFAAIGLDDLPDDGESLAGGYLNKEDGESRVRVLRFKTTKQATAASFSTACRRSALVRTATAAYSRRP